MFTLSQASYDTKELLKWGGLFIGGLVVVIIFIQMFLIVKNAIFPTPPPKPTVTFGKLDPQLFPPSVTDKKLNYKINTLTGSLPNFKDQLKVYKIKTFPPDLLSLQNASDKVDAVNFKSIPIKVSETNYEWTNTDALGLNQTINMNTINYNFSLTSDFLASPSAISGTLPNEADSIKTATEYLSKINTLPRDIDTTNAKTSFFAAQNGAFVPVASLADADAVRVDLFQKDVDNLPIAYEQPNFSNINVFVGVNQEILQVQYFYQTPSSEFSTYPTKTSEQAYADLENGIAYIASYKGSSSTVSITDAFPAYYISSLDQKYLMPIIVFEGSDNFTAYVPAVTDGSINK